MKKKVIISIAGLLSLVGCNSGTSLKDASNITGNIETKVQNGVDVADRKLNSMIPLIYVEGNKQGGGMLCTGTLLNPTTILTAAHCVIKMTEKKSGVNYTGDNLYATNKIRIIFSKNLSNPVDLNSQDVANWNVYSVSDVFVHKNAFNGAEVLPDDKGFNIITQKELNDIAILKLNTPVAGQYTFASLANKNPKAGTEEIVAGYGVNMGDGVNGIASANGKSGVLRMANSLVSQIEAGGSYISVGGVLDPSTGYTKICQGDSGGPDLVKDKNNDYIITGIHSFGDGENCGSSDSPASSLSVAYYLDWINNGYLTNHL